MTTHLDDLLLKVRENPEKYEEEYYTCFMNTVLYIPVWDQPEEEFAGETEKDTAFRPVIIEDKDDKIILVFDTEERLAAYTEGREDMGLLGLQGYDLLEVLGTEFHLLLNPQTPGEKEFVPEEIEWLLSVTKPEE